MTRSNLKKRTFIILTDDFPPTTGGGIASWAYELSKELTQQGYKVIVLTKKRHISITENKPSQQVKIEYVNGHDWNHYRWFYMLLATALIIIKLKHPIIIASTWMHCEGLIYLKDFFSFDLFCFAHGTDITKAVYTKRKVRLRRVLRKVDLFFPVSFFLEKLLNRHYPDLRDKMRVIQNGVDTLYFKPLQNKNVQRAKIGLEVDADILLSVGRIIEAKGFQTVIRALPKIIKQIPTIRYVIVGKQKEPEFSNIKALITKEHLEEYVCFLSAVDYSALPVLYNASDIFVLTSQPVWTPFYQEEGFGIALIEAGACGLPAIGTNAGGIPEIIDCGKTGFIIPVNDHILLAEKVIEILQDARLRKTMGENARLRIEQNFQKQFIVKKLLSYLL